MPPDQHTRRGMRFTLRSALIGITIVALIVGLVTSIKRFRTSNGLLRQRLVNTQLEMLMAKSRADLQADATSVQRVIIGGVSLRGVVIQAGDGAFQRAVFDNSDLSDATLTAGAASFQGASFNNAILTNARLAGGGSSFQLATFNNAELSGAELTGNLQGVSLQGANCSGITIKGSFQGANIDEVRFHGADLSALRHQDLASCYFDTPPTFDRNTRFPEGFDPIAQGWKLAQ